MTKQTHYDGPAPSIPHAAEIVDHIEHLDDLPILRGFDGASDAVTYLRYILNCLEGKKAQGCRLSLKYDGSFSIIAGYDSRDGLFFVGKKSIFNNTPIYYKTDTEIEYSNLPADLKSKLKLCLMYLPDVITDGIWQGDFMFEHADLKWKKEGPRNRVFFQPNTILYSPINESVRLDVESAEICVAFHTEYTGYPGRLELVVNKSPKLFSSPDVLVLQTQFNSLFEDAGTLEIRQQLEKIYRALLEDCKHLDELRDHEDFSTLYKKWRNGKSQGKVQHFVSLIEFGNQYFTAEKDKRKTEKGKATVQARWAEFNEYYLSRGGVEAVKLCEQLDEVKRAVIRLLQKQSKAGLQTYYQRRDSSAWISTEHEGYVITNNGGLRPAKLIHRSDFSYYNHADVMVKGWER